MPTSERIAIAAHLHVLLRRKLGRITDTEWMASNDEYARCIVRLCHEQADADLRLWADRLDAHYAAERGRRRPEPSPVPAPAPDALLSSAQAIEQRYIGRLR
ncbi:hypothetical protein [Caldimonas tepidiphila]|uniref:hypothetical protein n=1 Tax=Caldimonas tepidiphila TaxID=2315841 RepID=UPI000E5BC527|nr:hypothetical protein [Caldimonas tepidiphila]